jgi:hypothetical protein
MLKPVLRYALLAFVAISLVALVVQSIRTGGVQTPVAVAPSAKASRLVAFYFHGKKRCDACNSIERLTHAALKPDTDTETVEIRSVDVDDPTHAHFVTDFALAVRTVVLAEEADGKYPRWKRLDECWSRYEEPEDFTAYLQASLKAFRTAPALATP